MTWQPNLNTYLNIISLVALAVVSFYVVRSRIKDENLNDLKERVNILEKERDELKSSLVNERETANEQHLANQKAISKLEGQVEQYKDLQLSSIAIHLKNLDVSNGEILSVLKSRNAFVITDEKAFEKSIKQISKDKSKE